MRFVDSTSQTALTHWIESATASSSAKVWLRVPTLSTSTRIYVHSKYTASTGDATQVFPLYDNFAGTSLNTTRWGSSGTVAVANYLRFSSTAYSYIYTKSTQSQLGIGNDVVVEASVMSESGEAIPEIAVRSTIATNAGIKGRWDCRAGDYTATYPNDVRGMGGILYNPYTAWAFASTPVLVGYPLNAAHTVRFDAIGNTFKCFYDGTQQSSSYTSTSATYNSDGIISLMNHNGAPLTWYWLRAYKGTTQNVAATVLAN